LIEIAGHVTTAGTSMIAYCAPPRVPTPMICPALLMPTVLLIVQRAVGRIDERRQFCHDAVLVEKRHAQPRRAPTQVRY
jgi:hypothetical protein